MPYSKKTRYEQRKQNLIDTYVEKYYQAAIGAIDDTARELVSIAHEIFDKCIDQYYFYKTRSYYRHETGRGTRTGANLYRANQIHLNRKGREIVGFHIGWDVDDMSSYKRVSSAYVLDNVMDGIRGVADEYMEYAYAPYPNHWSATVSVRHFGTLSGTPNQIFDEFDAQWKEVSYDINQAFRREAFKKIKIR